MEILFDYEVIKQLGKGKTGVSYLVKKSENYFVLKVMNQNVMDYEKQLEIFRGEKSCYERMSKIGNGIPKLFEFNEENLLFLVDDNIFIPSDRKNTFLKGLVAGFNLDLSTSMHLLMPQVENSIRCLAQECGAVVYKTDKNGVEACLSLESILKLPEVIDCLDETFLFNLRLFYTSDYGFGMRNTVSHSLYSDDELQSSSSLIVWWFTLKICCMFSKNLTVRVSKQIKEDEDEEFFY